MTGAAPDPGLPEFRARLRGGVHRSVAEIRSEDGKRQDARELAVWPPAGEFTILPEMHVDPWKLGDEPGPLITRLAASLAGRPELLESVVYAPDQVLERLLTVRGTAGSGQVDAWIAMCWTAEAAWSAVTGSGAAGIPAEDAAVLRPLTARLRFVVLSEPMRWRGNRDDTWWDWGPDRQLSGSGVLSRAFGRGSGSWERLVGRCREARDGWTEILDSYQEHRLLRLARPADLEEDVRLVVFGDGRRHPLALSSRPLSEHAPLTPEDRTAIEDCVERHLLPRFAIGAVARLMLADDRACRRAAKAALAIATAGTGLAAAGCAIGLDIHAATWLALACYALICAGIAVLPSGWGTMWLLRMPAASVVGVITLVTFMPGSWLDPPPRGWNGAGGWHAAALLVAGAFGYLLIQARNHGAAGFAAPWRSAWWRSAPWRSLVITVIGAVHALMISVLGLAVIAPAFVQRGWDLRQFWASPGYGRAGMVLALATAWCLAFGVFSQILWDDRPITAPLSHMRWRRGR